jgi:hypothetical protein
MGRSPASTRSSKEGVRAYVILEQGYSNREYGLVFSLVFN